MELQTLMSREDSEILTNVLTSIAILVGGGWTFWRFVLLRERFPKIEFNVDLNVVGVQDDKYIVEVIAVVENKGLVRQYLRELRFDLFYLPEESKVIEGKQDIN